MQQQISGTMRRAANPRIWKVAPILMLIAAANTGCLSIGGRTYTSEAQPETQNRITALETRVGALEHALLGTAATPAGRVQVTDIPTP